MQRTRDEHQKIHRFREGDVVAVPSGITHWCYNDGDIPLVLVQVFDTSNSANQLEPRRRVINILQLKTDMTVDFTTNVLSKYFSYN